VGVAKRRRLTGKSPRDNRKGTNPENSSEIGTGMTEIADFEEEKE